MKWNSMQACGLPVVLLGVLATEAWAQTQREYTLTVNERSGLARVVQINGHSCVDANALARIANASISYQGHEIRLNLPAGGGEVVAAAALAAQPNNGFSQEFLQAGIEYMAQIRE
jgi:hypothetical protein